MEGFFHNRNLIEGIKNCILILKARSLSDEFISNRDGYLIDMLTSMQNSTNIWSEGCQLAIKKDGVDFKSSVSGFTNDESSIDELYDHAFRMYTEIYITTRTNLEHNYKQIRDFTRKNIDNFSLFNQRTLESTLYDLPTSLCKDIFDNHDYQALRNFVKTKNEAESLKSKWDNEISIKMRDVEKIQKDLNKQKHTYNFISLHRGFRKIGYIKAKELCLARIAMVLLGLIIPALILGEAWIIFSGGIKFTSNDAADWIKLLPGVSLLLISIYYFRISLANVSSIKAQVIQINLRMSLCQFIENYIKFSSAINKENENLLAKFEEVIFSNIMPNAEKIPSTFDGIEQLAKLLASLKKN